jgi:L-alanine-DL-glutamate epimerase-like enolase superfamily enzyme
LLSHYAAANASNFAGFGEALHALAAPTLLKLHMPVNETTIQCARVLVFKIPTDFPESDGTADWDSTTVVVVQLGSSDQHSLGYTYCDLSAADVAKLLVQKVVLGKNVISIPALHLAMERQVRNMGRPGVASCALSAVDISLWDLKARLLGQPLSQLLGQARPHVNAYGSGGFTSYSQDQLIRQLAGWANDGFGAVKMKIGTGEDTVERVTSVSKALKSSCELYVDANGAYKPKQALHHSQVFADLCVTWFEEPITSDDLPGLHLLVEQTPPPIRIAAGEYNYTPDDARRMMESRAVDILQADATRCGGVSDFMAVGRAAEMFHLPFSAHTAPSVHTHLCCALNGAINVEYFHDHTRIEQMIFDGAIRACAGTLTPDATRPGLGLELKRSDAEQYLIYDSGDLRPAR